LQATNFRSRVNKVQKSYNQEGVCVVDKTWMLK